MLPQLAALGLDARRLGKFAERMGEAETALVSMTAVTKQYGAAHRAFLLVPLVGGFFIGIINAVVINWLVNW